MAGTIPKHHVQIASNLYVNTSCLNEDENAPHGNVLSDCDERFCSSDADEQLLFRLPFKAAVKLSALKIQCPNIESAPTCVKLFINTTEMGFDDAEDKKPTELQELILQAGKEAVMLTDGVYLAQPRGTETIHWTTKYETWMTCWMISRKREKN